MRVWVRKIPNRRLVFLRPQGRRMVPVQPPMRPRAFGDDCAVWDEPSPKPRKRSTKKLILCREGPMHGQRVSRKFTVDMGTFGFPVGQWSGWYIYDEGTDEFKWLSVRPKSDT